MLRDSQREFLWGAANRYRQSLPRSPAEGYLQSRGLAAPSAAEFALGYVEDPLPGHEMFRGWLAIPYMRWSQWRRWSVASLRFRCLSDHDHRGHGKYMTVVGDQPRLFNTRALLRQTPSVAIAEGEIDAMTAQLCGINTVGVPGAQSWKPYFREPFLGYREVFVLADGDEAGMTFANTVAKSLPNAKVIPCPPGTDVNSLVTSGGREALLERIT